MPADPAVQPVLLFLVKNISDVDDAGNLIVNNNRAGVFVYSVDADVTKALFGCNRFFQRQVSAGEAAVIALFALVFKHIAQRGDVYDAAVGQCTHFVAVIAEKQNAYVQLGAIFKKGDHFGQCFINHSSHPDHTFSIILL